MVALAQPTDPNPPATRENPRLHRAVVVSASLLLAVATLPVSFASGAQPGIGSVLGAGAGSIWFWRASGLWVLCPLGLVLLGGACALRAWRGDPTSLSVTAAASGVGGLALILAECWHEEPLVGRGTGPATLPAAGTYLALLASVALLAWPGVWARVDLRRRRRLLGGRVTAKGNWVEPELLWQLAGVSSPLPRAASAPVAPAAPAGWYPEPGRLGTLRWWDGVAWSEHRTSPPPAPDAGDPPAAG